MAGNGTRRNRRKRRHVRQETAVEVREIVAVDMRRGGASAQRGTVVTPPEQTQPDAETTVRYPIFNEGSYCRVTYQTHVVGADGDSLVRRRVAVPQRSRTVARRVSAYRPSEEDGRFHRDLMATVDFPAHWTPEAVLNWFSRGLAVMAALPATHLFPSQLRAMAMPIVHEATEAYGYDKAKARWTPDSRDIAKMELTLEWPSMIDELRLRKAFLMYTMGIPSAKISRILGYKSRAWGKKLALDAAHVLAGRLNRQDYSGGR